MVHFVLGGSGSGKSYYIKQQIKQNKDKKIYYIVPEQYSFESEKSIYRLLGASRNVNVFTFTKLSSYILSKLSGGVGKTADDVKKLIFMELAVNELRDSFEYFKKSAVYNSFPERMLKAVEEMKDAGVDSKTLKDSGFLSEDDNLARKTSEIALVYDTYNAIMERSCADPLDIVMRAARLAFDNGFFKGSMVFFDEFDYFAGNQLNFIKAVIAYSDECTFSLCLDPYSRTSSLFYCVDDMYKKIKNIARENNVRIAAPVVMQNNMRHLSGSLKHLERNIFSYTPEIYDKDCREIVSAYAQTLEDEVTYALSVICSLVRGGFRYRDIALIPSDIEEYQSLIESGMKKYGIPFFADFNKSVRSLPLIRFVISLLRAAAYGYDTDEILNFLKCGLTPFSEQDISDFENYIFVWDIKGAAIKNKFSASAEGFGGEIDEELILRVNKVREYVVGAVEQIKSSGGETADKIASRLFSVVEMCGLREKLESMMLTADTNESNKISRSWEILLELLDDIAESARGYKLDLKRFCDIFVSGASAFEIADAPQTIDSVTVGQADRIRIASVKAVIIIGANVSLFPKKIVESAVFSDKERELLMNNGAELSKSVEYKTMQERYNAYKAVSLASEKLFIVRHKLDSKFEADQPSEICSSVSEMFPKMSDLDVSSVPLSFFCVNKKTAFAALAKNIRKQDGQTAAIEAYLKQNGYAEKIKLLYGCQNHSETKFEQKSSPDLLFGRKIHISPSGFEMLNKCSFRFFCDKGLRLKKLRKSVLDPMQRGNIVHFILEEIVKIKDFVNLPAEQLEQNAEQILKRYLNEVLAGEEGKTESFLYRFNLIKDLTAELALRIQEEFRQSFFRPFKFEYKISRESQIYPITIKAGGRTAELAGIVDRIDSALINGERYFRVVDYKTGNTTFSLQDIYNGINLQMLIYLFAIWKNGRGDFADGKPAGVLYMPSGFFKYNGGKNSNAVLEKQKQLKMSGLILYDSDLSVAQAMERDLKGRYIPFSLTSKGGVDNRTSSFATIDQMNDIYRYIVKLIGKEVENFCLGDISAYPVDSEDVCKYCDYKSVCGIDDNDKRRELQKVKKEQTLYLMRKELEQTEEQDEKMDR